MQDALQGANSTFWNDTYDYNSTYGYNETYYGYNETYYYDDFYYTGYNDTYNDTWGYDDDYYYYDYYNSANSSNSTNGTYDWNYTALVLAEEEVLPEPTFEMNLDLEERDEYLAEFEEAYEDLGERVDRVLTDWDTDRKVIDGYYWERKLVPLIDEGARLDERLLRRTVTWVVDGIKIEGQPLEEVFPEVKEWMCDNYDPNGPEFSDKFGLNNLPMNLQEEDMTFSFDTDALNEWMNTAGEELAQNVQNAVDNYN